MFEDFQSFALFLIEILISVVVSGSSSYLLGWSVGEREPNHSVAFSEGFFWGCLIGCLSAGVASVFVAVLLLSYSFLPFVVIVAATMGLFVGGVAGGLGSEDAYYFAHMYKGNSFERRGIM